LSCVRGFWELGGVKVSGEGRKAIGGQGNAEITSFLLAFG
jgi:hypothetical protein